MKRATSRARDLANSLAIRVSSGVSRNAPRPDKIAAIRELVCDKCGLMTRFLRPHLGAVLCFGCKAKEVKL